MVKDFICKLKLYRHINTNKDSKIQNDNLKESSTTNTATPIQYFNPRNEAKTKAQAQQASSICHIACQSYSLFSLNFGQVGTLNCNINQSQIFLSILIQLIEKCFFGYWVVFKIVFWPFIACRVHTEIDLKIFQYITKFRIILIQKKFPIFILTGNLPKVWGNKTECLLVKEISTTRIPCIRHSHFIFLNLTSLSTMYMRWFRHIANFVRIVFCVLSYVMFLIWFKTNWFCPLIGTIKFFSCKVNSFSHCYFTRLNL